jgi:hypothetical protein
VHERAALSSSRIMQKMKPKQELPPMTTILKSIIVAAALAASGASISTASADAVRMACQSGQITTHGVWDCR